MAVAYGWESKDLKEVRHGLGAQRCGLEPVVNDCILKRGYAYNSLYWNTREEGLEQRKLFVVWSEVCTRCQS